MLTSDTVFTSAVREAYLNLLPPTSPAVPPHVGSYLVVAARLGLQVDSEPKKDLLVATRDQLHWAAHVPLLRAALSVGGGDGSGRRGPSSVGAQMTSRKQGCLLGACLSENGVSPRRSRAISERSIKETATWGILITIRKNGGHAGIF